MLKPFPAIAHLATSRLRDGLRAFFECLRDKVGLDLRLDVELFEAAVLLLKLLHPRHQRHVHTGVLATPLVERRRTDPMFPAQVRYHCPGLRLPQHRQDLAARKPRSLHVELPPMGKFYFSGPHLCAGGGDYHIAGLFSAGRANNHYGVTRPGL